MPSLKDVKMKIAGVKKTAQITKAMNMVSSARLRGAQLKMEAFRPYAGKFDEALRTISANMKSGDFALMQAREVKTVEILVVTSDRGLCGSFNSNIIKMAEKLMNKHEAAGKKVTLVCVGKKANRYFRKTGKVREKYVDIMGNFQMFNARAIAQDVAANFIAGGSDEVHLIYGSFISVARQLPKTLPFLPVKSVEAADAEKVETKQAGDYIYEPSPEEIMDVLLPLYTNVMVYNAML
ncbi:MAG: ATP synthase F1 subunit gamma, partial [Desulfobulbaceae bacterium]|nr:ATP synthase F1 subunit gamma [Desulfobulbaceae bacterium]